jgi:hypothetical protein
MKSDLTCSFINLIQLNTPVFHAFIKPYGVISKQYTFYNFIHFIK